MIAELLGVKELLGNFCVAIFAKQSNDLSGFCLEMKLVQCMETANCQGNLGVAICAM